MADTADLWCDDDGPPSGVRERVLAEEPRVEPAPVAAWLEPAPAPASPSTPEVLAEVTTEVFFEVWRIVRAISPLRTPWLRVRRTHLLEMARVASHWRGTSRDDWRRALGHRWPELVPGHEAMNMLATVMVDALC